ncbi:MULTISPECIES: dimethylamine monooxygenase subunit DmmA family protein [unclassified Blastococcus]
MGTAVTSDPREDPGVPDVDPAARWLALFGLGPRGAAVVARWRAAAPAHVPLRAHTAPRADDAVLDLLTAEVDRARVGWRLMVAGPEVDVLAVRARATALGVLDAEIRAAVTDTRRRRVWCASCGATTETSAPAPGEAACAGCGRRLHVHAHLSRRLGAHLGSAADPEERT